ncbi:hypothetical protein [Candidatus Parabeggiatoa sp. HSG14]|uniref:hypothetical protein n=1 Tax=Candidatus Parabeggiatoa sp. HSG14 TaxID=3055593 RepID=UPI0025A7F75B|nr:hypothetical protein [Thiotrichales bacterium HSG14]
MKKYQYIVFLAFLLLSLLPSYVLSLENHYWSNQFGSRSALMGGAVVGGVRDTSAGYYNPGALGFVEQESFAINANGYKAEFVDIVNGAGTTDPVNITSMDISSVPLLLSGTVTIANHSFGYSLVGKNQSAMKMSGRHIEIIDVLDSEADYIYPTSEIEKFGEDYSGIAFDGIEDYRSQFIYESKISEMWGGVSWANKIAHNVSIGVSSFFAFRSQHYTLIKSAKVTNEGVESGFIGSEESSSNTNFYNLRGLLKLGIAAEFCRLRVGAALTTPSLNLFGKGDVGRGFSKFKEDQPIELNLADDHQNELNATYKTPLSLAVGLETIIAQNTHFAATVEWFTEQKRYNVITPKSRNFIVGNSLGFINSQEALAIVDEADSVVNFAFAFSHKFTHKTTGYLSFRTDFETHPNNSGQSSNLGINNWDIYHATLGITRKGESSEIALGLTYSFGHQGSFKQLANLNPAERISNNPDSPEFGNFILAPEKETSVDYRALGVIIGYTHYFK